ncbi:MAG: group 1 truncated hemoglobin [Colwellia polaris]|jgi:hemoglobin|uniref:group I truncated hemoglobin n=1 Tax=Colwellia polaris TaxID=326537 RepID=UPI0018E9DC71|nr:group 1 truncated hemoglobin [Colwellia polaris]|tara:strand:+ start:8493 stop:8987 length:495 start_codon:yes stop_codon:yes gene_type:complete
MKRKINNKIKADVEMGMRKVTQYLMLVILLGCAACASPESSKNNSSNASLYQKIGQKPAIDNIIDNLVNLIGQDNVVFSHFAQSNVTHFKEKLSIYLCNITDGPCKYNGDTMQDIHKGMHIDTNQFNHFVELFIAAMEASNISYPIQNQLLARLAPLRESIIKM